MPAERASYHHGDLRAALLRRAAEVIDAEGIEALTLRGLARDLGVSHGAPNRHFRTKADLLAALAADAYAQVTDATLSAAEEVGDDPWVRLNAMGRGFLRWALANRAAFTVIMHPDVQRYADDDLREAVADYRAAIRAQADAAQAAGRHPDVDPRVLTLYTNAVPLGAAVILSDGLLAADAPDEDIEGLIAAVVELVVPIKGRAGS